LTKQLLWRNSPRSGEHEQEFAKRQESHKKARPKGTQPFVKREVSKKVEETPQASEEVAQDAGATAEAEPKTEE
jgi:hypothetical protein